MHISQDSNGIVFQVLKGVILAVLTTLFCVLAFAFLLSLINLSDKVIKLVNQIIKLISILLGCFFAVRNGRFFLKGGLIGFLSAILTVLLFALISSNSFSFIAVLIDVVFGFLMGGVSGLIIAKIS